ncbi:hypothetical protein CAter10_1944 [Collimonas arenae]|nr:hypothetical protein CAter10_1944 [Collimonas arenae]
MRKVKSNCNAKSNGNFKGNRNNNIKTNPAQLNGVGVFFAVLCENCSDPI